MLAHLGDVQHVAHLRKVGRDVSPAGQRKELICSAHANADFCRNYQQAALLIQYTEGMLRVVLAILSQAVLKQSRVTTLEELVCQVAGQDLLTILIEGLHKLEGSEEGAHTGHHPLQAAALWILHAITSVPGQLNPVKFCRLEKSCASPILQTDSKQQEVRLNQRVEKSLISIGSARLDRR